MSDYIIIEASTYDRGKRKRLAIFKGNGGTRIKGAKFNYFESDDSIEVPLTEYEAKLLYDELGRMLGEEKDE